MNITIDTLNLAQQVVEVNQFDNNAVTVTAVFPSPYRGISLAELKPCILISSGDRIVSGSELTVGTGDSNKSIIWKISERYTQKAGTYFLQYAFADSLGTIKVYSERFILKVNQSVDYAADFLKYNPAFIDRLWAQINQAISDKMPTKLSELTNDAGYVAGNFDLRDYAKKTDLYSAIGQVSGQKRWRKINAFTLPNSPAGEVNHVTFLPDSSNKYTHSFFLNSDSLGNPFSLSDVSVYFKLKSSSSRYLMNTFVYANAPFATSGGTALFTGTEFITAGSGNKNEVNLSRNRNRWHVETVCQSEINLSSPVSYAKFSTENLGDRNISSLRIILESAGSAYQYMTGGIEVEIWGVDV